VVLPGDAPGGGGRAAGARRPQGAASAPRGDASAPAGAAAAQAQASAPATAGPPVALAPPAPAPASAGTPPTAEQRKRFLEQVKDDPEALARRTGLLAAIDRGDAAALARWQQIMERRRQGAQAPAQ
jgi:multidrug efflux system membrane fusion protein